MKIKRLNYRRTKCANLPRRRSVRIQEMKNKREQESQKVKPEMEQEKIEEKPQKESETGIRTCTYCGKIHFPMTYSSNWTPSYEIIPREDNVVRGFYRDTYGIVAY